MGNDTTKKLSIVIPLWNEEKNIQALVEMLAESNLHNLHLDKVVMVNNGSTDRTGELLKINSEKFGWIFPLELSENQNYGGGVWEGAQVCRSDFIGYIPGDLQVHETDVVKVWSRFLDSPEFNTSNSILIKGSRNVRKDGFSTQFVSKVYTILTNQILGTNVQDVNGLPKIFHRNLLGLLPRERMKTFVFDAQLIYTAQHHGWEIVEVPVTFHARREGVSSWSSKRLQTYWKSLQQIRRLREIELP